MVFAASQSFGTGYGIGMATLAECSTYNTLLRTVALRSGASAACKSGASVASIYIMARCGTMALWLA